MNREQQTCPKCGQPLTHEADGENWCVKCTPIECDDYPIVDATPDEIEAACTDTEEKK